MGVLSAVARNQWSPIQQQMHDQINCKKESYRLSSTCGAPRNYTNVPPVDAHVDDSYMYQLSLVVATATVSLLVCWPKITLVKVEDKNWLGFRMGGPNWLDFCLGKNWFDDGAGMKPTSLFRGWLKLTWVWTRGENHSFWVGACILTLRTGDIDDLSFVWVIRIEMISVWRMEHDLIPVYHEINLVVVWVVENDSISVSWIVIGLVYSEMSFFRVRI